MKMSPKENFSKRSRRRIRAKKNPDYNPEDPENNAKFLVFHKAVVMGNCCWRAWDSYARDGMSLDMPTTETFEPGWRIAVVEFVKDCTSMKFENGIM